VWDPSPEASALHKLTSAAPLSLGAAGRTATGLVQVGTRRTNRTLEVNESQANHRTYGFLGRALREKIDLDALSDDVLAVVRETMQPAHVSPWLRTDVAQKRGGGPEETHG
jgi:hypothetical protein